MLEGFKTEEQVTAPAEAYYLINSWDGVEWHVCWRAASNIPWVIFAVEKSPQEAYDRMYKHVKAQQEKPMYFGNEGHLLNG